jgi:hypothetical protein
MTSNVSPYLKNDHRLADVIAAIQAMGTYKFYKLDFNKWADRISGDESQVNHWKEVFKQHPEFSRLDSQQKKASLVLRRQHQKLFDVDNEEKITKDKFKNLLENEKMRISRMPLRSDEIATLVKTAINLHSRALEQKKEDRWLFTLLAPALAGFAGVVIGAVIVALK